jgi:uncharacterized membrane protein
MICPHCAAEMPEISSFCPACGLAVRAAEDLTAGDVKDALLGAAAYLTVVPAVVLLAVPALRRSPFVRFHAWQSVFFAAAAAVLGLALRLLFVILSILPLLGFLLAWLLIGVGAIAVAVTWVVLVVKAAQGHGYELPVIGPLAARVAQQGYPH